MSDRATENRNIPASCHKRRARYRGYMQHSILIRGTGLILSQQVRMNCNMPDDEPSDDSSTNKESGETNQSSESADNSGSNEGRRSTNGDSDEDAPGSSLLEWFQSLDRKEKIAVIAGSLAILKDSGDAVSSGIKVVDDIASTESPSDSDDSLFQDVNISDLSLSDQYPSPDYNTPAEGAIDWHVPVNENFEHIEEDIEILRDEMIMLAELTEKNIELLDKKFDALNEKVKLLEERVDDIDD